jgi:4'-phosphopantetheinyl transferase
MRCEIPGLPESRTALEMPELAAQPHVWIVEFDPHRSVAPLHGQLSQEEINLSLEYVDTSDRVRFVLGRVLARQLIAVYLGTSAAKVCITSCAAGKPALAAVEQGDHLEFNLSHSGGALALAFSKTGPVGVDIEFLRPSPDFRRTVLRLFCPGEREFARRLAASDVAEQISRIWCRKESFLKGLGVGLSGARDLQRPLTGSNSSLPTANGEHWWISDIQVEGYAAAVAFRGAGQRDPLIIRARMCCDSVCAAGIDQR